VTLLPRHGVGDQRDPGGHRNSHDSEVADETTGDQQAAPKACAVRSDAPAEIGRNAGRRGSEHGFSVANPPATKGSDTGSA